MAYMDQAKKSRLAPAIKAVCKKYAIKVTIGVRHYSTLVINLSQGELNLIGNFNETCKEMSHFTPVEGYIDVNPYHFQNHFTGECKDFLTELFSAINAENYDRSDIMTDYFDLGYYVNLNIGKWNKPYILTK